MDIEALAVAAAELRELASSDGADLRLVQVDTRAGLVELELDLSTAGCADCVVGPTSLREMADFTLKRSCPGDYRVVVLDPRESRMSDRHAPDALISIVNPAAEFSAADRDSGPDAGDLKGKTVGFRVDILWRSWDWVVDEWSKTLEASGVKTVQWRRAQDLDGMAGQEQQGDFVRFLDSVDAAVVGLGNCGSCTSWTIKDAVAALEAGLPTVATTTAQFEQLGHTLAGRYGRPGLRLQSLPYPLDVRPEEEVRLVARESFPAVMGMLGAFV